MNAITGNKQRSSVVIARHNERLQVHTELLQKTDRAIGSKTVFQDLQNCLLQ